MNLKLVLQSILTDYQLPLNGDHGVSHWARVLENGLRLREETGADVAVVSLFAVLHDSRRINEVHDPDHGPRAALFASELRGRVFDLDDHQFSLLTRACEATHTSGRTRTSQFRHAGILIDLIWDVSESSHTLPDSAQN
jgi:uncharacterized protein